MLIFIYIFFEDRENSFIIYYKKDFDKFVLLYNRGEMRRVFDIRGNFLSKSKIIVIFSGIWFVLVFFEFKEVIVIS